MNLGKHSKIALIVFSVIGQSYAMDSFDIDLFLREEQEEHQLVDYNLQGALDVALINARYQQNQEQQHEEQALVLPKETVVEGLERGKRGQKRGLQQNDVQHEGHQLKKPKKVYTGEKSYSCNECGKSFGQKSNLTTHMRTHTGEKSYSCNECGKAFGQKSNLTTHMRTHTGEKPYSCNECGKSFTRSDVLKLHMRTHTGEKSYSCNECGKSFTRNGDLTSHMRIHTGEQPYSCNVCGKAFARNGSLTTHMSTHTGEKPYSRNVCERAFARNSDMVRHKGTHKTTIQNQPAQISIINGLDFGFGHISGHQRQIVAMAALAAQAHRQSTVLDGSGIAANQEDGQDIGKYLK
jgi:DNA-directed RNA polymerase subunit RPC12/RpoP